MMTSHETDIVFSIVLNACLSVIVHFLVSVYCYCVLLLYPDFIVI